MSRPFTVLIDLDSTVYNLWAPTFDKEKSRTGRDFTSKDITTWNWPYENDVDVQSYWNQRGFFLNLKPFPHSLMAIRKVEDWGIKQVFFSVAGFKYGVEEKLAAINRDFPFISSSRALFTGGDKDLAYGDVLIDDGPHNHEVFETTGGVSVIADLQESPYCRLYKNAKYIMTDWRQYPEIILQEVRKRGR